MAVNKATNKIYMPNPSANTVTVMDGLTLFTTSVLSEGRPVAVAVNETANKIYVTNSHAGTVTVIDGATLSTTTVTVGDGPDVVAVNAVTNKVYVANNNSEPSVTVIDGITLLTVTLRVPNVPRSVAVNAVTNKVYFAIANWWTVGMVTIVDGATDSTSNLAVGYDEDLISDQNSIAVNPVTNRIYVTNFDTVSVIDGTPPTALQFVPLTPPCRAVDTRPQYGGGGPIQAGTHQDFGISGAGTCDSHFRSSLFHEHLGGSEGSGRSSWRYGPGTAAAFVACASHVELGWPDQGQRGNRAGRRQWRDQRVRQRHDQCDRRCQWLLRAGVLFPRWPSILCPPVGLPTRATVPIPGPGDRRI